MTQSGRFEAIIRADRNEKAVSGIIPSPTGSWPSRIASASIACFVSAKARHASVML